MIAEVAHIRLEDLRILVEFLELEGTPLRTDVLGFLNASEARGLAKDSMVQIGLHSVALAPVEES